MTRKARMIVRVMPSRNNALAMASRALANGKIDSHDDAQAIERIAQGNSIYPSDLLHRVKQGAKD